MYPCHKKRINIDPPLQKHFAIIVDNRVVVGCVGSFWAGELLIDSFVPQKSKKTQQNACNMNEYDQTGRES